MFSVMSESTVLQSGAESSDNLSSFADSVDAFEVLSVADDIQSPSVDMRPRCDNVECLSDDAGDAADDNSVSSSDSLGTYYCTVHQIGLCRCFGISGANQSISQSLCFGSPKRNRTKT